ncbi:mechanosensitive ion channel family protein [Limibaculum sp. FT325]|uniref:mechanosensitive ion channel family protein n=1 Tax=Thermohalobaculum sediminis TaxID=2939436 RepID=UPI0020BF7203|nr:mechanosensitive ion channel family protein [Limibaculum sediminis]MCL5779278.1 mechanosensitive ion channel family protein [Limibaculum sediminis]
MPKVLHCLEAEFELSDKLPTRKEFSNPCYALTLIMKEFAGAFREKSMSSVPQVISFPSALCKFRIVFISFLVAVVASLAPAQETAPTVEEAAAASVADAIAEAAVDENARNAETGVTSEVLDPDIDPTELEHRLVPMTKEELAALTAEWLKIVKTKTEEVMAAQIAIDKTEGTVEDAARARLTELVHSRKALFDKYSKVIAAWEKKGGDPEEIADYRAYRSAIIIEETRTADYQTLLAQALSWLTNRDGGIQLGIDVTVIIASLLGLLFFGRVVRRFARRWIGHVPNLSKLLQAFLVTVVYWIVLAIGLMVVLSALGIDISPVFALIGGASFILAFAFQDTLGNLASGLMIMVNRPFDEGDYVDVGGVAGTVRAVSIVATTVVTPDNQIIVIPNKNVWGNVITNVTASDTRRVDLVFGISYEDSIPEAQRVIENTVKAHPLVMDDPAPVVRVHELAESSVNFICRPWAKTSDYWSVYWDLTQQVKQAFDAAGISIPYPQRDIHLRSTTVGDGQGETRQALREI